MIDLIKLGDKTYYLKNPVNVGIFLLDDENVCVIDTGNSKQFGKLIEQVLNDNNWNLKYIINTHSHADHIGGNNYLQNKYECKIYSSKMECHFIEDPLLEPSMLYSANPTKDMMHHMLLADKSYCEDIENINISGLEIINLDGHSAGQIGVVTSDRVCFVGDAYTSDKILNKYAIQYVYDIKKYLQTLEYLKTTNYNFYVPAHGEVENDCRNTIDINIKIVQMIEKDILSLIAKECTYNDLIKGMFEKYHISMNMVQYHLISATIKSYLTKLETDGKIEFTFVNNDMVIKVI